MMHSLGRPGQRTQLARSIALVLTLALGSAGCAATPPYVGQGPYRQIDRGHPIPPIDFLGNVFSLLNKLLLWNWKVENHAVSADTEAVLAKYLDKRSVELNDLRVQINEWAPHKDLARLWRYKRVAWPYRLLLGLPVTLISEVLIPGRIFGGDHYNPFTNTVHLYSDLAPIALHEAGHAYDFSQRRYRGTYALLRILPGADLYQEFKATDEAIDYSITIEDRKTELQGYKILYPAYGTYIGQYFFFPFGLVAVIIGHIHGRNIAEEREERYQQLDAARQLGNKTPTAIPVVAQ